MAGLRTKVFFKVCAMGSLSAGANRQRCGSDRRARPAAHSYRHAARPDCRVNLADALVEGIPRTDDDAAYKALCHAWTVVSATPR